MAHSPTTPWYATREQVTRALDVAEAARTDSQIDQALASGVDAVHGLLHRILYPVSEVRTFDWPNHQYARGWRLWLDGNDLISVDSITNGADGLLASGDYLLRPSGGPPYTHVEIDRSSAAGWSSAAGTSQDSIQIDGLWGFRDDEGHAGTLATSIDATETAVVPTNGSTVGVGDLVRLGAERMVVVGRGWVDSAQNLGADLAAQANAVTVSVSDGSVYFAGEQLLIDAERMLITDVAGNTLVVRRAYRGSVLAAHTTGADVYVDRSLTVDRGCVGTTSAAHDAGIDFHVWRPPTIARTLNLAEALVTFEQEKAAYARTVGSGETEREARGPGIEKLRDQARTALGRMARVSAI